MEALDELNLSKPALSKHVRVLGQARPGRARGHVTELQPLLLLGTTSALMGDASRRLAPQAQPVAGGDDDGPPSQGEGAPDSY